MIKLPWPPSVNHYWVHATKGRHYIGKAGKQYRRDVQILANTKYPMKGRLSVKIDCYPPDSRQRDLDNILKALLDALQHAGVYEDDSQIDKLLVTRCEVIKGGAVCVQVDYR